MLDDSLMVTGVPGAPTRPRRLQYRPVPLWSRLLWTAVTVLAVILALGCLQCRRRR
jgi:hypothetical protein